MHSWLPVKLLLDLKNNTPWKFMTKPNPFNPLHPEPLLIVISGPSGVGKDSVLARMKERSLPFYFVVTATTRARRPNETEGVDYFFVSHDEFAEMIEKEELLEYAYVYNDWKGIRKAQVRQALSSGQDVVMRLDVQGAATIHKLYPDALLIFLTTQDEQELVNRLKIRRTESPDELNLRIAMARQELKRIGEFDYVIVNRECQLDESVNTILSIIQAEHHKVHPRKITL
jgi:guanylate kinase